MTDPVTALILDGEAAQLDVARITAEIEHAEKLAKVIIAEEIAASLKAGMKLGAAEYAAHAGTRYKEHLEALHQLRLDLGPAQSKLDAIKARLRVWQSREDSRREEMRGKRERERMEWERRNG